MKMKGFFYSQFRTSSLLLTSFWSVGDIFKQKKIDLFDKKRKSTPLEKKLVTKMGTFFLSFLFDPSSFFSDRVWN